MTPISSLGELNVNLLKPKDVTKNSSRSRTDSSKNVSKNRKSKPKPQTNQNPEVRKNPRKQKILKKVIRNQITDS